MQAGQVVVGFNPSERTAPVPHGAVQQVQRPVPFAQDRACAGPDLDGRWDTGACEGAQSLRSGIINSCPGKILSGSSSIGVLASKIFMYFEPLPYMFSEIFHSVSPGCTV